MVKDDPMMTQRNQPAEAPGRVWPAKLKWLRHRYIVTVLLIAVAAALRVWPLSALGSALAWLTFYPALMVAAVNGGISAGLLATSLACLTVKYLWPLLVAQPFIKNPADWLGLAVFFMTGTMISCLAEAMHRAQNRAKLAQEKAEAANKAKSVFLASMSHELRTPLNAILGFSSLMRHDANMSEEQRQTLDLINRSGEHLLGLINDVLDMAKIEAGRLALQNAPFDLGGMIRDLLDLMRGRAEAKGLELELDQSSEFPRFVRADAAKLRQVFLNLLGNAIKFTMAGRVTLRLNSRPGLEARDHDDPQRLLLVVEVEDTGIGIAPEDKDRVFDPFIQVSNLTLQKGTGLGLTITRQQVELMGGRISLESAPGRGSLFRVEIPVERVQAAEVSTSTIEHGQVVGLAPDQPEYRLLIVEDQMENWLFLQRLLKKVGFAVRVVENGAAGVEMFQTWHPHLIWMDIRMPVMGGLEATGRIRAMEGGRAVKIVALTASVFKEERDNVMASGMDDFIRKPYRAEEIYDCVGRQLQVRFIHEKGAVAAGPVPSGPLRPEELAGLPPELCEDLTQALLSLDAARIGDIIRNVSDHNPALGARLAHHAERLEYTTILQAVRSLSIQASP